MFELIIILSLAIIFFIFLVKMPEVEKIESKISQAALPVIKTKFLSLKNWFGQIKLSKLRQLNSPKPTPPVSSQESSLDLYLLAEKKFRAGDLEAAEKLYLRLAVITPNEAKIYASLGRIYLERLNYKDAVASFKAAVNRDRKNGFYFYDLAIALYKDGRFKEASLCFEKSILINNRIPNRHLGLGLALMKLHDYSRAAAAFSRAYEIEPNNKRYERLRSKAKAKVAAKVNSQLIRE